MEQATALKESGHLGSNDVAETAAMNARADASGVKVLLRLGNTETFAVRQMSRSVPGSWVHVQTTDIARPAGSAPPRSASREKYRERQAPVQGNRFLFFFCIVVCCRTDLSALFMSKIMNGLLTCGPT